ncbi:MAG: UbiA family prenyltransferase [Candidatus Hadarchaeum sp.]|uniref:UbiA family prenyltransferase n=1 Tax=Candidatus Hadarchaeum sp. TaxID=2883567 RepID=UPI003D098E13
MKAKALYDLMRLDHGVMLFVAVLIGALIANSGTFPDPAKLIFSFLTALLLEASTFALNDYLDLEIDRRNRRMDRPLVRGDLDPRTALAAFYLLFPLGILFSFLVNLQCFIIAAVTGAFAILYDLRLKKAKVIGNLYIAYIMAVPFIFGAAVVSPEIPSTVLVLALIAFLSGEGREIMKDIMDIDGDRSQGVQSLPLHIGERNARRVAALFYLIAALLSFIPFALLEATPYYGNFAYLFLVCLADALFLITAADIALRENPPLARYRKLTLISTALGLLAFLIGAFPLG